MNPEWMEWAKEHMPPELYEHMVAERHWDAEWRDKEIISLTAERDELRETLQDLRIWYHAAGRRPEECYEMAVIDSVLQEDRV